MRLGEGWDPTYMFNPAIFSMHVLFSSHEPCVIYLFFVQILYIHIMPSVFPFILFYIVISSPFIADYVVYAIPIAKGC